MEYNAGVVILDHDGARPLLKRTYTVQYECCGAIKKMRHDTLLCRVKNKAKFCIKCASKGNNKERRKRRQELIANYGIVTPNWPVPASVIKELQNEI